LRLLGRERGSGHMRVEWLDLNNPKTAVWEPGQSNGITEYLENLDSEIHDARVLEHLETPDGGREYLVKLSGASSSSYRYSKDVCCTISDRGNRVSVAPA
jgi:hypothetical protein